MPKVIEPGVMEPRSESSQNLGCAVLPHWIFEATPSDEDTKINKILFPKESGIYMGETDTECFSFESCHIRGPGKVQLIPEM